MRLIVDVVLNHTSDEHPWFVESRSSRDNPKRDWYWWRTEPNNWRSFFSEPAWTRDEQTDEYYLHLFSAKQPDLNWENPQVRQALYAMLRWWLDKGVDGFRMDVINMISKDPALPDGWVPPGETLGHGFPHFLYGPRIHEYLHEMHTEVFAGRDRTYLVVGEMPGAQVEQARLYTDPARGEVDMVFQFDHVGLDYGTAGKYDVAPFDLRRLKQSFGHWQSGLADDRAGTRCTGTTTTSRASSRGGAMTATSTGSPRRRPWRRCCTCTAERRTSTRAKSWA